MNKLGKVAVALAMVFSVGAVWAAPIDIYVTVKGAGDMDGRDWDHAMFSITEAYALCAANAEGGTVHVAGGIYRSTGWDAEKGNFTQNAAIVPASNVTLLGCGDKDNPTILTGDCGLDNVWNTGTVPCWQNGKLVEPAEDVCTFPAARGQVNDAKFCSSSSSIENCRFENLTIHGFTGVAIALSNARDTVFSSCRFIGMGSSAAHDSATALNLADMPVTITNCMFIANRNGVTITAAEETSVSVVGCLFRGNCVSGAYDPKCVFQLKNNVRASIEATVFRYNYGQTTCGLEGSALGKPVVLRNVVFENCTVNADGSGSTICNVKTGGTFDECLFVSNTVKVLRGNYTDSAAVVTQGNCKFYNSYFGYSSLTKTSGSSTADATVLSSYGFLSHVFVNCTAESNRVEGSANPCSIGGNRPLKIGLANCVFRNNDCVTPGGVRQREFYKIYLDADGTQNPPMFVNTIIWNDAEDYVPFVFKEGDNAQQRMGVASCDIKNYTPAASATGTGFLYQPIVDEKPKFADGTVSDGTRRARPLTVQNSSDIRSKAVKVCRADTGDFFFLDTHKSPNQWRKIADTTVAALTLEEGEAVGLAPSMAAYADVFGAPRRVRASMGPVDAPPLGLMMLVR